MSDFPKLVATKPLKTEFSCVNTIQLTSDQFTLGRSLGNSAVIAFLSLSRKHCIFRRKSDSEWTIEDVSAFGIRLNDKKLSKGKEHALTDNDILQLEPTGEFIYRFVSSKSTNESYVPPCKKQKLEGDCDILKDAKQKFEESQCLEVESLEIKIKNAQQMQNTSIIQKRQLQEEMEQRMKDLNEEFKEQIENLRGEKEEVERQKAELEKERDDKLAEMTTHMDHKISELQDQISRHTATEKSLTEENCQLRSRLEREREEFLSQLREAAGRDELLRQLQERCQLQEEARLREKQELETTLRRGTEQLRILQEQIEARAEAERQLREDKENTEKCLQTLKMEVAAKELQLNEQAEKRVKEEAFKSQMQVNALQEQLDRVRTELECEKIVRLFTTDAAIEEPPPPAAAPLAPTAPADEAPLRLHFSDLLESEMQCTICADLLIAAVTLGCSHTFCKYCIAQWKKKKKECPICRTGISSECRSLVIDSFIEKMVANLSEEMKLKRLQILKDREELELQTSSKEIANASRGRDGSEDSDSESGSWASDSSSEGGARGRRRGRWGEDDYEGYDSEHYDSDSYYSRYYRAEFFDYDSGSDGQSDTSEDVLFTADAAAAVAAANASIAASLAGAAADPRGGPSGSGSLGPGTDGGTGGRTGATRDRAETRRRSRQVVAGVPGSYYGGYGRCYNCGARGHWAPGCPAGR